MQQLRELGAEHELVGVHANVGFEVNRGLRVFATLEAIGGERERIVSRAVPRS